MIPKITLKDLPFYQEQGAILIDVRDPMEYQMGLQWFYIVRLERGVEWLPIF